MIRFPRIERLPPYVFNITGELKMAARRRGEDMRAGWELWLGENGEPRYDVHDGTDGWRRVLSQPLPGTSAAV